MPYRWLIAFLVAAILLSTVLEPLQAQLPRPAIDRALPTASYEGDAKLLVLPSLGMILLPLLSGLVGVGQRQLSARVDEGIIYDLRSALDEHLCAKVTVSSPVSRRVNSFLVSRTTLSGLNVL